MRGQPYPVPAMADFQHPDETLIGYRDTKPDSQGRRHMVVFWIADNTGPHLDQVGVRGHVVHCRPDDLAARYERVRFLTEEKPNA